MYFTGKTMAKVLHEHGVNTDMRKMKLTNYGQYLRHAELFSATVNHLEQISVVPK